MRLSGDLARPATLLEGEYLLMHFGTVTTPIDRSSELAKTVESHRQIDGDRQSH
jgi:hypothetical protein